MTSQNLIKSIASYLTWAAKYYFGFVFAFELLVLKDKITNKNCNYILLYHRVIDGEPKKISYPLDAGLISKGEFEFQMRYLSKRFQIVPLKNLVQSLKKRQKSNIVSVAVTFDDGYNDNYLNAYPILKEYNIPATMFLVTEHINKNKIFWWDKISCTLKNNLGKKLNHEQFNKLIPGNSKIITKKRIHDIIVLLRKLSETDREKIADELVNITNLSIEGMQKNNLLLSWKDIKRIDKNLISLESHSKTHSLLTQIRDDKKLKEEIYDSKRAIEKRVGNKVHFFAYPYGEANRKIKRFTQKSNYLAAFSADVNVTKNRNLESYSLRRIIPLEGSGWFVKNLLQNILTRVFKQEKKLLLPVGAEHYTKKYFMNWGKYSDFIKNKGSSIGKDYRIIVNVTQIKPGMKVLDLGCGRGELPIHLAQLGASVDGIDYSRSAIRLAKKAIRTQPKTIRNRIKLSQEDVKNLSLSDNQYDRIIMCQVIEHLRPWEVDMVLKNVKKALKKDGYVIVSTFPNRWLADYGYPLYKLYHYFIYRKPPKEGIRDSVYDPVLHINEQTTITLKKALKKHGFSYRVWLEKTWFIEMLEEGAKSSIIKRIIVNLVNLWPLKLLFYPDLYALAWKNKID